MSSGCVNAIIMSSGDTPEVAYLMLIGWKANQVADDGGLFCGFWQITYYQDNVMKPFICVAFA